MAVLQLILGPDPILKQKAADVTDFGASLSQTVTDMFDTLYEHRALGMGANMVGILKKIVIIDLQEDGIKAPLTLINPTLEGKSEETSKHEEASLCYPGISAEIERANAIKVSYQNIKGEPQTIEAEGFLATVIQHEMDYLDGRVYLDYISKMKRDRLIKKMQKQLKHSHCCADPDCGSHQH